MVRYMFGSSKTLLSVHNVNSVSEACRTVAAEIASGGSDRRPPAAQRSFAYERKIAVSTATGLHRIVAPGCGRRGRRGTFVSGNARTRRRRPARAARRAESTSSQLSLLPHNRR